MTDDAPQTQPTVSVADAKATLAAAQKALALAEKPILDSVKAVLENPDFRADLQKITEAASAVSSTLLSSQLRMIATTIDSARGTLMQEVLRTNEAANV